MKDLKEKTIRGGLARLGAQAANFALRILSLVVLARLLDPKDFGLVGMVTAFTGVLSLFRDFGLSSAVIQRADITEEQISTLFWINLLVGIVLAILTLAMAPVIAAFYHEPRLLAVTAVLSVGFFVNAAGVQHGALLQRELKFTAVAIINTVSLVLGTAIGIGMAIKGYGYWALVVMTVVQPLVTTVGCWLAVSWIPGRPHRRAGIRSMMHFGGTITLNSLVVYIANNFEKILLGRFWGADALGIYGRAYQLINIPTDNLNSAAGEVAFSALSRLQNDPPRLKNYFLKGYSLILAMTLPVTIACALFAGDIVMVFLGPKWREAVPIFRLLAPTILVFAIVNPLGWLLYSTGLAGRALKMGLVISPLMIGGYALGLRSGPKGVAFGYSAVMVLWVLPAIAWAVKGTAISFRDIIRVANKPMASSIVAGGLAFAFKVFCGRLVSPWMGLTLETGILIAVFALVLLFVAGEKSLYFELYRSLTRAPEANEKNLASV
jgi:O-antigen/teichoic acid export membrane protein